MGKKSINSGSFKKSAEVFKASLEDAKKEMPTGSSKVQKKVLEALAWATFIVALIPAIFVLVGVTYEMVRKLSKASKTVKTSAVEAEGERAEGEEQIVQMAMEGLRARAKAKKEEQDREFTRRVKGVMKSEEQGRKHGPDFSAHT